LEDMLQIVKLVIL